MRAGRLNTPATLLSLSSELECQEIDWIWCGIQTKEATEPPYPSGLRNPAKVTIRAWWDERLRQGRYLRTGDRLFHIDSVRDFTGLQAEVAITATEFIGGRGEVHCSGLPSRPCRVFLTHEALYRDELGQAIGYKTRAEVALIEAGRVQVDDQLLVGCDLYNVISYDDGSDDGIVRGLWLDKVV